MTFVRLGDIHDHWVDPAAVVAVEDQWESRSSIVHLSSGARVVVAGWGADSVVERIVDVLTAEREFDV